MRPSLTLLGSGNSTGVPIVSCRCAVCRSRDPRDRRTRPSALIRAGGLNLLIDTAPDLRAQALREKLFRVDAVLFTHVHADHTHGIDELRVYNYLQKAALPAWAAREHAAELKRRFDYIFTRPPRAHGGGSPQARLTAFARGTARLDVLGVPVIPLPAAHGPDGFVVGYRVGDVAYLPDIHTLTAATLARLRGLRLLALDCLRLRPADTHLNLERALELAARIGARRTVLTHLGHEIGFRAVSRRLPPGVELGFDGWRG